MREGERFLDAVEQARARTPRRPAGRASPPRSTSSSTTAGEDPLVRLLLSDDGTGGMLPLVTTQASRSSRWASARLTNIIAPAGRRSPADAQPLAECLVRLAISYVTLPKGSRPG